MKMKIELSRTSMARRVDDLGRVVIPKEVRKHIDIKEGDQLEIYLFDGGVAFTKYDETTEKGKQAEEWLKKHANLLKKYSARFIIDGSDTVTCECIMSDKRYTGMAKCSPEDTFNVHIGMLYAFCRAAEIKLPEDF